MSSHRPCSKHILTSSDSSSSSFYSYCDAMQIGKAMHVGTSSHHCTAHGKYQSQNTVGWPSKVSQKQLLRQLAEQAADCFADAGETAASDDETGALRLARSTNFQFNDALAVHLVAMELWPSARCTGTCEGPSRSRFCPRPVRVSKPAKGDVDPGNAFALCLAVRAGSLCWRRLISVSVRRDGLARRAGAPWDGLFGNTQKVVIPNSTREVLDQLKASMGILVKSGLPRADVDLPAGLRLGMENVMDPLIQPAAEPSKAQVLQADRELARVFLAMFKVVKDSLSIVFRTSKQAAAAKKLWGDAVGRARVVSMPRSGMQKTAFSSSDEGEMTSAFIQSLKDMRGGFVVVVAPRRPQLAAVARAAEEVDSKTGFILLNARLRGVSDGFNAAFHLRLCGREGEGLVYRALQDGSSPWILARRKLPSTIAMEVGRSFDEPSDERINEVAVEKRFLRTARPSPVLARETSSCQDGKGLATLIAEESEDLWHLFNLSMKGDTIKAMTYRKIQKEGSTGTVQTEVRKIQMTVEVKSIEYDAAGNCIRYSGKNCEDMLFIGRASPGHVQSARVLLTLKTALREALPLQLRSPERQDWRVGCGRSGDSGSAVVPGHHAMQRKRFNHGNLEKLLVDLAERFPPSQEEVAVVLREEMELWHRTPKFATALLKALARRNLPSIATDVLAVMARQSVDSRLI
eukprot:s7878_g1.t1